MDSGFRRSDGSTPRTCGHIHCHSGSPIRHCGLIFSSVILNFSVIPAKAGIYACRLHYRLPQPSFRLLQPSFRRKPESMAYGHIHRHYRIPQPSFRRKPESMPAGPIADSLNRHSGASRNLWRTATFTVITGSPNRHSGESRNLWRKETLPPAPTKFPISHSNLPQSPRRPKSGHTSALPLAPTPAIPG